MATTKSRTKTRKPAATTARGTRRSRSAPSGPYWERVAPLFIEGISAPEGDALVEYETGAGGHVFELVVYDDRADLDTIHIQFARVSSRGRRVATLDVDGDLAQLTQLHSDLGALIDALS